MFVIALGLVVAETGRQLPKGVSQAKAEISAIVNDHIFTYGQNRTYLTTI